MVQNKKHILLGVTGSIAAYKAADLIRLFSKKGHRVSAIMTRAAEEFITPLTLATLSNEKVWRSMFDSEAEQRIVSHISLAREADALVIAPASADIIGKIANGIADDLLSTVAMATRAPIVIAPAMNLQMYENPVVQKNCETLKGLGMTFVGPEQGELACGEWGNGRLAELQAIADCVEQVLDK
ncbi:MAG TPA: flavoprotein [Candidatus Bathyarchaeia archaeon]|nr:flavoprotein [Candidatus Bathyarchaeia archaeon]